MSISKASGERSANKETVWRKRRTIGETLETLGEALGNFKNLAFANVAK